MLVQHNDIDIPLWPDRTSFYGITAMPTIAGNGLQDVWPTSWLEADFQAHAALPSPLTITLTENGIGDFTAHIEAEEDVTGALFCMVATHDDMVPCYGGGRSHMPYHVVEYLTSTTGDAFELLTGQSIDIQKTFTVQAAWDYDTMGVACWVQKAGGFNPSPCPYADLTHTYGVLQACFSETNTTSVPDETAVTALALSPASPNPFAGRTRIAFALPAAGDVSIELYDAAGRRVTAVFQGRLPGGEHEVSWDGRDASGHEVAAGIYFVRLMHGQEEITGSKLVKLR